MKKIILLSTLLFTLVSNTYADTSNVKINVFKIKQSPQNQLEKLNLGEDGNLYGLKYNYKTRDLIIAKVNSDGVITELGAIPHPDIKILSSENYVQFRVNNSNNILISYRFYNAKSSLQYVFYTFKNKSWVRLADYIPEHSDYIDKIFIDGDDYYFTFLNNYSKLPLEFYKLNGNQWTLIDNPVNNPKTEISGENIITIENGAVYTTSRTNLIGKQNKYKTFMAFKYNTKNIDYADGISLDDNVSKGYVPVCSVVLPNDIIMTALANIHDNLTKQTLRFDIIPLNKTANASQEQSSGNSLFGSIISIGKSISSLAASDKLTQSNENNSNTSVKTIAEIDVNPYFKSNPYITENTIQCTNINNSGYFIMRGDTKNGDDQYITFKVAP